ncbi:hypothetical protein V6N13_087021 [Hibiscus sabdariffa]
MAPSIINSLWAERFLYCRSEDVTIGLSPLQSMLSFSSNDTSSSLEIVIGVFGHWEMLRLTKSELDGGLLLSSMVRDELGNEKVSDGKTWSALCFGVMFLRRLAAIVPRTTSTRSFSSKDSLDLARTIAELNKEMESVFGEPPPDGLANSGNRSFMAQEPQHNSHANLSSTNDKFTAQELLSISHNLDENAPGLTHVGSTGEAQMVDVSPKENSSRTAIATCKVLLGKKVFDLVLANQMAKGDVLTVAKIAGINGAKHTSTLIPLCHNITLAHVRVDLSLNPEDFSVDIEGEAASTGKTGVEMEAMTAVSIAGLTVYDMCKAASKDIQITDIQLECKTGGKSGYWRREN